MKLIYFVIIGNGLTRSCVQQLTWLVINIYNKLFPYYFTKSQLSIFITDKCSVIPNI